MAFSIVHQANRGFHTLPEKKLYKISDLGSRIAVYCLPLIPVDSLIPCDETGVNGRGVALGHRPECDFWHCPSRILHGYLHS